MIERDKFLTEAMGECWHHKGDRLGYCGVCGGGVPIMTISKSPLRYASDWCATNQNFSTWVGFGKLWEFCQEQEWWMDFLTIDQQLTKDSAAWMSLISPNAFANAVYEYLKDRR